MADVSLPPRELGRLLQSSRRFWETDGRDGSPLVMPGTDLSHLDLREQVFASAQLQGADFRNSLLDSAVFVRAALDGALLSGSTMFSTDASRASLVEAKLTGVHAARSRWNRALLARADLTAATLDDANLSGAELIRARLDRASLLRADLTDAVLLGATFQGAHLEGADLRGAAVGSRTFVGAVGASTESAVGPPPPSRRRRRDENEFETTVRDTLRRSGLQVHHGFKPSPDLVLELDGPYFAAVEVSTSADRTRLFRMADRSDLIVVPDALDVRRAMNNTPVAHLAEAPSAVRDLQPSGIKPYGAAAMLTREAARLRPYVVLAEQAKGDPSFISRLSVYLDTRQTAMLNARDRAVAEQLPAHLDGAMAARSARWAESHDEQLRAIISAAARVLQGHIGETREVTVPAASALDLERQLASATAG